MLGIGGLLLLGFRMLEMSFCDDVGWGWEGRDEILKIYVTFTLGL
jgi:hypothetical protein